MTLLPRHWEWLNGQRGGASVALRRLVDEARAATVDLDLRRRAQVSMASPASLITRLDSTEADFSAKLSALLAFEASEDEAIDRAAAQILASVKNAWRQCSAGRDQSF